jgi:nucleotide-binding universal stress UspA family protein
MAESPRIVVGVDGSEHARRALRWALDEARLRHATVEAVHAWRWTPAGDLGGLALPVTALEGVEAAAARETLDDALAAEPAGDVPLERRLVSGAAAHALLDAAKGADLLVVGSRGHGGFTGLLLGSVSQQVSHHAPCPVVIVPTA